MATKRPEELVQSGGCGSLFPLTPALSPTAGVRGNRRQRLRQAGTQGYVETLAWILPRPRRGGEGWGEGEEGTGRPSDAARGRASAWFFGANLCVVMLLAALAGGCVTKSKAQEEARRAYFAGQQEAMMRMQQAQAQSQGPSVTVVGEVRNRVVPWTEGLTLRQALVAADYYGKNEPSQVIIVQRGIGRRYDLKQVLSGPDMPLEPGDLVQLLPPSAAPKP